MPRKQSNNVAVDISNVDVTLVDNVAETTTAEDYKKLNETCNQILEKIKKRKQKKN